MRNVTVTLDEETARWARIEAARRDESLSSLLRSLIEDEMSGQVSYASARERYLARPGVAFSGKRPKREDLHDRAALR